ncbi:tetratricopeptide repeat protein [Actinopolyspora mortivallis]|uniref:tetratricopeptide repeat protein n=1 Tax=Actinopolyspora mortivallis TaxID=33906 RepID=UPI0003A3373A|nr:hypothetical protein [Actinopolyspora mortivallis]
MARERGSRASRPGQELLESAWQWRWRVPELALLLGNRAASWARENGDPEQRLHAEYVALFAANRLGHAVAETERALGVFREAERIGSGELLDRLRIELAHCARGSGSYDVASRVLDPLLEKEDVPPRLRAHALVEFCGSLPMHRRSAERLRALDEADRLYAAESEHHRDLVGLLRARVDMARAGHHRGHGEFTVAIDAALRGMEYLRRLGDSAIDSGGVRAGLVLEQTQGLLELGRTAEAVRCSEELLHQPPRAAAATPVGWLRLALATRVHLPAGRRRTAVESLHEALDGARKHELFDVQTATLNVLANLHEAASELPEALRCLREAYSVDHRYRRTLEHARLRLLEEFPAQRFQGAAVPRQQSVGEVRSPGGGDTGAALHRTPEVPSPNTAANEDTGEAARRLLDALVRRSEESEPGESPTGLSVPETSRGREHGESPARVAAEDTAGTSNRGERRTRAAAGAKGGGRRRREAEPSVPPQPGTSTPSATAAGETKHGSDEAASTPSGVSYLVGGRDTPAGLGEQATGEGQPADFPTTESDPTPRSHGVSASGVDYGWHFAAPREDPSGETSLISTFPGSESGSADTTTVLPVLPSEPETADTSPEVSSPPSEDLRGLTGRTPGGDPPFRQETPVLGQHHTPRNSTAASEEEHRAEQHEEASSGRRSHGRSLAEIKAAIEAEQQGGRSARDSGPETFRSGGRRRRAASEDDSAEQSTGSTAGPSPEKTDHGSPRGAVSEELLEQSRELIRDLPGVEAASERVDGTDQSGLADLLAEALVAYQHGRQETSRHDTTGATSHTSTVGDGESVSGERKPPFDRSATDAHDASPSDVPGREGRAHRRHAVGEEGSDGSRTWTPQVR